MSKFNSHVARVYGLAAQVGLESAELAELYDGQKFDHLSTEMRDTIRESEEDLHAAKTALDRAVARLIVVQAALRVQSMADRQQFDFLKDIELG